MEPIGLRVSRRMDSMLPSRGEEVEFHSGGDNFGWWPDEDAVDLLYEDGVIGVDTAVSPDEIVRDFNQALKATDYKLTQLSAAFGAYSASWAKKDPHGFADYLNDLTALQARYGSAKAAATSFATKAIGLETFGVGLRPYTAAIYKAIQQIPGKVSKGDYQDLVQRLEAVGGSVDLSRMPQPPQSMIEKAYAGSSPLDVGAMLGGLQAPHGPLGVPISDFEKLLKWIEDHKTEIFVGLLAFGGFMIFGSIFAVHKAAPIILKAAI